MKASPAKGAQLPYDRWTRHVAENGLQYLAHPNTGEVKWLWSRHRDPKTGKDYLVNTVTSSRQWVNPANEHLCPVRLNAASETNRSDNKQPSAAAASANPATQNRLPHSSPPVNAAAAAAASAAARRSQAQAQQFIEVPAPTSLGLGPDEVLMEMRGSGRRYIFNKRTKKSRWLPGHNEAKASGSACTGSAQAAPGRADGGVNAYPAARTRTAAMPTPPPRLATEQAVAGSKSAGGAAQPDGVTHGGQPGGNAEGSTQGKMKLLNEMVEKVDAMTTSGKYAIQALGKVVDRVEKGDRSDTSVSAEAAGANQNLLELNEYLMQQTLKVDGVESQGDAGVRKRRKETVDKLLHLIKQTEELRRRLREA